jgi:hypothetical protein
MNLTVKTTKRIVFNKGKVNLSFDILASGYSVSGYGFKGTAADFLEALREFTDEVEKKLSYEQ